MLGLVSVKYSLLPFSPSVVHVRVSATGGAVTLLINASGICSTTCSSRCYYYHVFTGAIIIHVINGHP